MSKPLRLSTSQRDGTVTVMVAGELDAATAPDLKSCLAQVLLAQPSRVIVHLGRCSFIDAGGLGTLVTFKQRAQFQHTALLLGAIPARMLRLMKLIGLDHGFDFLPPPAGESTAVAQRPYRPQAERGDRPVLGAQEPR